MRTSEPFAVVTVPFPYVEIDGSKKRPALLLTPSDPGTWNGLAWVLMITGARKARWDDDIDIDNLPLAGLRIPSLIRPAKVATVQLTDIHEIGRTSPHVSALVRSAVRRRLGLEDHEPGGTP